MLRLLRLTLAVFPNRECGTGHESPVHAAAVCDHGDRGNRRLLSAVPLAETRQVSMVAVARSGESVFIRMVAFFASCREWQSVWGVWRSLHHRCDLLALACRWSTATSLGSRWRHCMPRGHDDHHAGSENIVLPDDSLCVL